MEKRILFIILLFAHSLQLFAQDCDTITKYDLKGRIINTEGVPVESVIVSLLKNDSTIVAYAITNSDGQFEIKSEYTKDLILCASHIGYEPYKKKLPTSITPLQNIVLKPCVLQLDEVVVAGEKPIATLSKDGNICFNVNQIRGNASADITNILNRLPGVTANQKQGLTLNGQQATLYIDGRKQSLSAAQAISILKTMPVETVDQVELNSYTGASYEASTGPVINIITSKRKEDGWGLSVNALGSVDRHNNWDGGGSAYVIARSGNVNVYGNGENRKHTNH